MKIFLYQIFNAKKALDNLFNMQMPPKVSFKVADIIDAVNPEFEKIEKIRVKLVKENLKEGESQVRENFDKFSEEFNEFLQEEVELDYEPNLSFEELPDTVQLTPRELSLIRPFFES